MLNANKGKAFIQNEDAQHCGKRYNVHKQQQRVSAQYVDTDVVGVCVGICVGVGFGVDVDVDVAV